MMYRSSQNVSGVIDFGLGLIDSIADAIQGRATDQAIKASSEAKRLREEQARESTKTMLAVGGMALAGILVITLLK